MMSDHSVLITPDITPSAGMHLKQFWPPGIVGGNNGTTWKKKTIFLYTAANLHSTTKSNSHSFVCCEKATIAHWCTAIQLDMIKDANFCLNDQLAFRRNFHILFFSYIGAGMLPHLLQLSFCSNYGIVFSWGDGEKLHTMSREILGLLSLVTPVWRWWLAAYLKWEAHSVFGVQLCCRINHWMDSWLLLPF